MKRRSILGSIIAALTAPRELLAMAIQPAQEPPMWVEYQTFRMREDGGGIELASSRWIDLNKMRGPIECRGHYDEQEAAFYVGPWEPE